MIEIKIGFVSRRGEGPVSLAADLIQEIESWNEGVGILVDEDLAVKIGRPLPLFRRWNGDGWTS